MRLSFQRVTSGSSWIPQIDGLRFFAIMSVLLAHAFGEVTHRDPLAFVFVGPFHSLGNFFENGARGVALFYVISGYILSRPFLRQHLRDGHKVSIGRYLLRRVTRLEPPYILSLLLYFVVQCLVTHPNLRLETEHLFASIVYLNNQIFPHAPGLNFVTWTLEIEIQFYLLAPLLGFVFCIRNTAARRAAIAALMGIGALLAHDPALRLHLSVLAYLHFFLAGFLVADFIEFPRHAPKMNYAWDLISLVGWPAFLLLGGYTYSAWLVLLLVPLCLAAFHGKASNWFFRQRFIALTGGMCYSIYLLHILVYESMYRLVDRLVFPSMISTLLIQMALLVCSALLASAVYFLIVERPCMDPEWPQKLWHKLHPSHAKEPLEPFEA